MSDSREFETILFEVDEDGIATVTLNRPEFLNAFDHAMVNEFSRLWKIVKQDNSILAVVLQAAGDRAFSTGADVKKGGYADPSLYPFNQDDPGQHLGPKSNKVWKPIICAVHGMCAGGAFYWLNESDIIICSPEATFFDPHVTFGLVAAVEPTGALARIPLAEVVRMSLLGNDERMSSETALRISLVTEIVPREKLNARAKELAGIIAKKHPVAIEGTVLALWEALDHTHSAGVRNALRYCLLGNPITKAAVDRKSVPKAKWTLR